MTTETTFAPGQSVYLIASKSALYNLGATGNRLNFGKVVPFRSGFAREGQLLAYSTLPEAERASAVMFDVKLIRSNGYEVVAR
jgi:hypothetical protein